MPTTPLLGIPQLTANQQQKEVTINNAIQALEAATNDVRVLEFAGGSSFTLANVDYLSAYLFQLSGASGDCVLYVPATINDTSSVRALAVLNTSGYEVSVRRGTALAPIGAPVLIPNGSARILFNHSGGMMVASQAAVATSFLELPDVPNTYNGKKGYSVVVNDAETGVEFVATGSQTLAALTDVDVTGNAAGKVLKFNGTKWVPAPDNGVTAFSALTDVPNSYAGQGGKLVRVKASLDGLEFVDASLAAPPGYTDEQARDVIAAALRQGSGIAITSDDAGDTITISSTVTQYSDEMVRDVVGVALKQGAGITIVVDDANDAITISVDTSTLKPTESMIIAVSDETTAIDSGPTKVTLRMPYGFVLSDVRASVNVASSAGLVTVDINENGNSVLSTKLTIDATEYSSKSALTPVVISDPALADDSEITIDIDTAGTGAKGLKVYLIGRRA